MLYLDKKILLQLCAVMAMFSLFSCKPNPETFAIHTPIYPGSGENVTFSLKKIDGNVENVKLYETVQTINASGAVTATSATVLLQEWNNPGFPIQFVKSGGYASNRIVNYRFEVYGNDKHYTHDIKFATRPYPVSNQPAPVYIVGDINNVLNLVFIPDTDMNINTFYNAVKVDIDEVFHGEDYIRRFRNSYNFFINPFTGHAHDYDTETRDHEIPSNWDQLSFAQGKVILHNRDIRDFAEPDKLLFSAEHYVKGTLLHESGHNFYRLADEYGGGVHWQESELPNNWSSLSACQSAAAGRGMSSADAHQMGTSGWYKLCPASCVMESSGTAMHPYERPCRDRILYSILHRAGGE
ncbi:MAG: hypothetical protein J0I84_10395 [Terrimonas sp.]|nr:hypothetical protein [Terrimonas sp.]OJY87214.1 MAG: hypothetical protein BGP13_14485 [Sphingobacteriales bacterium 40-81]